MRKEETVIYLWFCYLFSQGPAHIAIYYESIFQTETSTIHVSIVIPDKSKTLNTKTGI